MSETATTIIKSNLSTNSDYADHYKVQAIAKLRTFYLKQKC